MLFLAGVNLLEVQSKVFAEEGTWMAGPADGIGNAGLTASAVSDDLAVASWSFTRSLLNRRYDPTATLLLSGKCW